MKIPVILLSFLVSTIAFSQNYDFGKVSKEELKEAFNPLDSSACATYLFKDRNTFFEYSQQGGFQLVTEIKERVKIYNQKGFEYATKTIKLHKNNNEEEAVSGLKAYTYNLVDGKIEKTKLDKSGIFENEISKYLDEKKFTMQNIKPGTIIEYKYKIYSPFYTSIDEFVFQEGIPIKKLKARFETPEYFNFKLNSKGYLTVTPKKESSTGQITFVNKTRTDSGGMDVVRTSYSNTSIDFMKNIDTYSLSNIPALKDEPHVNNINNYRSAIKYELSFTRFPNSAIERYSSSWEDVVKRIYDSSSFGDELQRTSYFKEEIDNLIGKISDPKIRIALIFNYVKANINWNGYYGYYVDEGLKKAFKNQTGNVADINLMLTSMLRYAGVKAYPVLVSTRRNGVPLFPTREGFNYVVSYVKLDGGGIVLDATSKYSVPNLLPFRALNWKGRVIAEKGGSTLINLYPKQKSKNTVSMMVSMDENGDLDGSYRSVKTNYKALLFRQDYNDANKEGYLEKLENKYNGIELSDYEVKNNLDLTKPITESYKFSIESQADIIGDKIYFSPLLFLKSNESPFKLEKRKFPVDFGYPSTIKYRIIVNLPDGYEVESYPKSGHFVLPDNLGGYKYSVKTRGSQLQLFVESDISEPIITPLYYDALKSYFSMLVEKESEQVVLKKI